MILRTFAMATLAVGSFAVAATAAELEAGYVDFSYSSLTDGADGDRIGINGGAEYQVGQGFNLQVNTGANYFEDSSEWQGDLSVHGIYTPLEYFAAGAYLGYEGFDGFDSIFAGIEGRFDFGNLTAQSYFQIGEAEDTEFRSWGASGRFAVTPGFGLGVFYDEVELPGAVDLDRFGASADYRLNNRFGLFAKIGSMDTAGSGGSNPVDSNFVEIGGRILFGGNGQTTFDKRSVFGIAQGG